MPKEIPNLQTTSILNILNSSNRSKTYTQLDEAKITCKNLQVEKSATSLIKFKHFTHKWTIDDFESLLTRDLKANRDGFKYVESAIFSHPNDDRVQFKILLYPNGDREEAKNYVSIYLSQVTNVDKSIDVYCKISILNENNEKCNAHEDRRAVEKLLSWGWGKFISRDKLLNVSNKFFPNGKLTFFVEINVAENETQICQLQNNLQNSLENDEIKKFAKINNGTVKWKIEDFNSILNSTEMGSFVKSPEFNSHRNDQIKFFLRLFSNGLNEECKDYLSLQVVLVACDKSEVTAQHKFAILDRSNEKLFCWFSKIMVDFTKGTTNGPLNFITKNELITKSGDLLPDNTLTIVYEIDIFEEEFLCKEIPNETSIPQMTSILDNLSSNNISSKTYTHLEVDKFAHTWTVDNFKVRCDEQLSKIPFIESQQFFPPNDNPIRFNLRMYPRGYEDKSKKFISIFLARTSCEQMETTVECRISIVNFKQEKCFSQVFKGVIDQESKLGIEKFIQRDILLTQADEFLPDGKLTITCELGIVGDSKVNFEELPPDQSLSGLIGQDFNQALVSGEHSDVVFVVEGQEVRAHKIFLTSRSPVFAAMFRNNMRESNENRIEITDFGYEVFRDLLSYIYSGKYQPKDQNIADLFIAADKYNLDNLKILCENSLCSMVNRETVATLLTFADTYNAEKLKTTLFDYINLQ